MLSDWVSWNAFSCVPDPEADRNNHLVLVVGNKPSMGLGPAGRCHDPTDSHYLDRCVPAQQGQTKRIPGSMGPDQAQEIERDANRDVSAVPWVGNWNRLGYVHSQAGRIPALFRKVV